MVDTILKYSSFSLFSSEEQNKIETLFNRSVASKNSFLTEEFKQELTNHPYINNSVILARDIDNLLQTNPTLIHYLTVPERNALEKDLLLSYFGLYNRYQKEDKKHVRQNLPQYYLQLEQCAFLIRLIRLENRNDSEQISKTKEAWSKKLLELALDTERLHFGVSKTVYITKWLSDFNSWRVYWGYAKNLLIMSLNLLPDNFYHMQQTQSFISYPHAPLGYISWTLYYTRFLINFSLIIKHSIKGPWMSKEEKDEVNENGGSLNHFIQQLKDQKLSLLNDFIWATNNLVCFFWLVKDLSPWGSLLTCIFLTSDIYLASIAIKEETKKHQQEMDQYDLEIAMLEEKIKQLGIASEEDDEETKVILRHQLAHLKSCQLKSIDNWNIQFTLLTASLDYTKVIFIAYFLMVIPWDVFGLQEAVTLSFGMAGAFLAFAINVYFTATQARLQVEKFRKGKSQALTQSQTLLAESHGQLNEANQIRYLDLLKEIEFQDKNIQYQQKIFIETVAVQALLPLTIFTAFTFAPFSIALAVMALGIVISLVAKHLIEKNKPIQSKSSFFSTNTNEQKSRHPGCNLTHFAEI